MTDENASRSESYVEKQFQRQFHEILQKGFLSRSLTQDEKDSPNVYTVNSVNKIKQMPVRLPVQFKMDENGRNVEREDFEKLKSSDYVHEQITLELDRLARPSNFGEIAKVMIETGDGETLKLFDAKGSSISMQFFEDLAKLESNSSKKRSSFIGPIYSSVNRELVQKHLGPLIRSRRENKADVGQTPLLWIAPSDPFWGKSSNLQVRVVSYLKRRAQRGATRENGKNRALSSSCDLAASANVMLPVIFRRQMDRATIGSGWRRPIYYSSVSHWDNENFSLHQRAITWN